jgi:hypothetical protein
MSNWQAIYFDTLDRKARPARTAMIDAPDAQTAGTIATAQLGLCVRVDLKRAGASAAQTIKAKSSPRKRETLRQRLAAIQH